LAEQVQDIKTHIALTHVMVTWGGELEDHGGDLSIPEGW
jgi:hypothetical protein